MPAEAPIFAAIDAAPLWGVEHPFARCGKEVRCPIVGNDVVARRKCETHLRYI